MMTDGRRLLWGVALAVDAMWFVIGGISGSTFLAAGALLYALLLVLFLVAEVRSGGE